MKSYFVFLLTVIAVGIAIPSYGQGTNIFSCSAGGWSAFGACGAQEYGTGYSFNINSSATISNSNVLLMPYPAGHSAASIIYLTPVNVQAFTANFTFVPNGVNVAFTLNNTNNLGGGQGATFAAGAGCEGGFYQAFTPPEPNNVFALELDSDSPLKNDGSSFVYSSAMIYQAFQDPCIPPWLVSSDPAPDKISTSPVPLNAPATTANTTTGDTYSATITYDGNNLTLALYDVTAGAACPGPNCFTHTWSGVNIPAIVGGNNTAFVGLNTGSNSNPVGPLWIYSFSYAPARSPSLRRRRRTRSWDTPTTRAPLPPIP